MPQDAEPKLTVHLKLDDAGLPVFVEDTNRRRYGVILEVENAPPDAFAATVDLDPSATYDSAHTLKRESDGAFRLEANIHGDSPVIVRLLRSGGKDLVLQDGIARGLRRAHGPAGEAAPVNEAVSYIAEH